MHRDLDLAGVRELCCAYFHVAAIDHDVVRVEGGEVVGVSIRSEY